MHSWKPWWEDSRETEILLPLDNVLKDLSHHFFYPPLPPSPLFLVLIYHYIKFWAPWLASLVVVWALETHLFSPTPPEHQSYSYAGPHSAFLYELRWQVLYKLRYLLRPISFSLLLKIVKFRFNICLNFLCVCEKLEKEKCNTDCSMSFNIIYGSSMEANEGNDCIRIVWLYFPLHVDIIWGLLLLLIVFLF